MLFHDFILFHLSKIHDRYTASLYKIINGILNHKIMKLIYYIGFKTSVN